MKNKIILTLLTTSILSANSTKINNTKDLSLSVYNSNLAMINETREFELKNNSKQDLIYEGIASSVIFESIIPNFSKPTILYSQNYKYDILTLDKLLSKNINKTIKYKVQVDNFKYKIKEAKLLAIDPIILQSQGQIISGINKTDIIFDKIPSDLLTKPSLIWETKSKKGKQDIKLNYLTTGISWKSDYILNINKENTLNGWISITNNSGATYKDANIYCIAGDINSRSKNKPRMMYKNMVAMDSVATPIVRQKEFAGYHLYKIPFKQTIYNKQKKQINFLKVNNIKINEYASVSNNIYLHRFSSMNNQKFNHKIKIKNSLSNNMGIPLPKGTIRVYKKEKDISHFIGLDNINHTSKDGTIVLNIGKYFDITQEIKQINFNKTKTSLMSHYIRVVKNRSNQTQTIKVKETNYSNNIKRLENTNNCKENCSMKKIGINSFEYTIKLKPNTQYKLNTKYSVTYNRY